MHGLDNNLRAYFFGPQGDTRWNQKRLAESIPGFEHHELDIRNREGVSELLRRLLLENGFAIRWLTYWTTLLFPLAVLARTLGGSVTGRDFDSAANSLTPRLFRQIMALELSLLRRTSLPIGVALLAAARKSYGGIRSLAKTSLSK